MSAVVLYQFQCDWDLPNPSPFCFKVETWLRMSGIEYDSQPWAPKVGPLGKAPTVAIDGEVIADSNCIIEELTHRKAVTLDDGLTPAQLSKAHLARRTLEEHTYWALMEQRWLNDAIWKDYRFVIGSAFPLPDVLKPPLLGVLRRNTKKAAHGQGLCRHPSAEVAKRGIADLDAIASLFEGDFFLGDAPRSIDATLYAWAEGIGHPSVQSALCDHLRADARWTRYRALMRERFWSDWDRFPALPA